MVVELFPSLRTSEKDCSRSTTLCLWVVYMSIQVYR